MMCPIFIISLSLALIVLLGGLFLLAYAKKNELGKFTKIASYVAIVFGTVIFIGGHIALVAGPCHQSKCGKDKMECSKGMSGGHCEKGSMECHKGMSSGHCDKGSMDCHKGMAGAGHCDKDSKECTKESKDCCKEGSKECKKVVEKEVKVVVEK